VCDDLRDGRRPEALVVHVHEADDVLQPDRNSWVTSIVFFFFDGPLPQRREDVEINSALEKSFNEVDKIKKTDF
jgi:hypothetical protein